MNLPNLRTKAISKSVQFCNPLSTIRVHAPHHDAIELFDVLTNLHATLSLCDINAFGKSMEKMIHCIEI